MKVVLTGGHLSPALAVIDALPKDTKVLFIGRKYALEGDDAVSLEQHTARQFGIPFESITTGRIQRKITRYSLFSLAKIPVGFWQSYNLLKKYRPDVVITFGGYLSVPVAFASYMLKIPVVIHEQTLEAGMANRFISAIAKKVCISWESSRDYFPKNKTVLTGNPLRKEFLQSTKDAISFIPEDFEKEELPLIYITGGSTGSHAINKLIQESINSLLHSYRVIHQTGDARSFQDFEHLTEIQERLPKAIKKRYLVIKFVSPTEVSAIMKKADLVISRSGINTITELIYLNKMSLLIPLPDTQKEEQKKNALFLKNMGLGEIVDQETTSTAHLMSVIDGMIKNRKKYALKNSDTQIVTCEKAAANIVEVVTSV